MRARVSHRPYALVFCALIAFPAAGQDSPDERPNAEAESQGAASDSDSSITFTVSGTALRQFDADLDEGGEADATRFGLAIGAGMPLTSSLSLNLALNLARDDYQFSGAGDLASLDPWDDVNTFRGSARFMLALENGWAVWGGPVLDWSAESGADESGLTYGGAAGASVRVSDTLTLGAGVGVASQIEDSASFFPIIVLDWRFAPDWTLRTIGDTGSTRGGGVELAWAFAERWELCGGAWFESRRFRLDDDAAAPDGVGEDSLIPTFIRLRYRPTPAFSADLLAGAGFAGEMRVEDEDGDRIVEDDLGAAPFIALRLSVRF
jgi:hypothetical protein